MEGKEISGISSTNLNKGEIYIPPPVAVKARKKQFEDIFVELKASANALSNRQQQQQQQQLTRHLNASSHSQTLTTMPPLATVDKAPQIVKSSSSEDSYHQPISIARVGSNDKSASDTKNKKNRRLSQVIKNVASQSGVGHLIGIAERGKGMGMQGEIEDLRNRIRANKLEEAVFERSKGKGLSMGEEIRLLKSILKENCETPVIQEEQDDNYSDLDDNSVHSGDFKLSKEKIKCNPPSSELDELVMLKCILDTTTSEREHYEKSCNQLHSEVNQLSSLVSELRSQLLEADSINTRMKSENDFHKLTVNEYIDSNKKLQSKVETFQAENHLIREELSKLEDNMARVNEEKVFLEHRINELLRQYYDLDEEMRKKDDELATLKQQNEENDEKIHSISKFLDERNTSENEMKVMIQELSDDLLRTKFDLDSKVIAFQSVQHDLVEKTEIISNLSREISYLHDSNSKISASNDELATRIDEILLLHQSDADKYNLSLCELTEKLSVTSSALEASRSYTQELETKLKEIETVNQHQEVALEKNHKLEQLGDSQVHELQYDNEKNELKNYNSKLLEQVYKIQANYQEKCLTLDVLIKEQIVDKDTISVQLQEIDKFVMMINELSKEVELLKGEKNILQLELSQVNFNSELYHKLQMNEIVGCDPPSLQLQGQAWPVEVKPTDLPGNITFVQEDYFSNQDSSDLQELLEEQNSYLQEAAESLDLMEKKHDLLLKENGNLQVLVNQLTNEVTRLNLIVNSKDKAKTRDAFIDDIFIDIRASGEIVKENRSLQTKLRWSEDQRSFLAALFNDLWHSSLDLKKLLMTSQFSDSKDSAETSWCAMNAYPSYLGYEFILRGPINYTSNDRSNLQMNASTTGSSATTMSPAANMLSNENREKITSIPQRLLQGWPVQKFYLSGKPSSQRLFWVDLTESAFYCMPSRESWTESKYKSNNNRKLLFDQVIDVHLRDVELTKSRTFKRLYLLGMKILAGDTLILQFNHAIERMDFYDGIVSIVVHYSERLRKSLLNVNDSLFSSSKSLQWLLQKDSSGRLCYLRDGNYMTPLLNELLSHNKHNLAQLQTQGILSESEKNLKEILGLNTDSSISLKEVTEKAISIEVDTPRTMSFMFRPWNKSKKTQSLSDIEVGDFSEVYASSPWPEETIYSHQATSSRQSISSSISFSEEGRHSLHINSRPEPPLNELNNDTKVSSSIRQSIASSFSRGRLSNQNLGKQRKSQDIHNSDINNLSAPAEESQQQTKTSGSIQSIWNKSLKPNNSNENNVENNAETDDIEFNFDD